jgi:hypothetical protein
LVFIDVGEDLVMVNGVVTPSNHLVVPVEEEEFEETPFDVNVFQQSCDEKPFKRVVHTQNDHLAWDRRLSPNPHVLMIYLEFVLACGFVPKWFEECQCENDDVHHHY